MSDAIWAIWSDSMGHPYTGSGRIGHIVVATDDPHIPVYLELNDGGHYPGYDCAVASSRSCLAHAGLFVPDAITVEVDESTAPPEGTFLQNIPPALRALGLPCGDPVAGLPSGSWIMNPMFGMDPRTSAYDNASQGWYIPIGAVPLSNTQTTGGTAAQEDPDAMTPELAQGLGRLVAAHIYGGPTNADVATRIANDILSMGLASAMDKAGKVQQPPTNEIGLVERVNAIEAGKAFPPRQNK